MDKVYIAGPIFNKAQLDVVRAISITLTLLEYEYFSPYENSQNVWKGRAPKDCSPEERQQVLKDNIANLHWTEILLAWVGGTDDGRSDTGVTWEMGAFNMLQQLGCARPVDTGAEEREWCSCAMSLCERTDDELGHQHKERLTLAYIHPTDKRQNMNLMLAGTVNAVAYGPAQLHKALSLLRDNDVLKVRQIFHPDKHIIHEKEPIV